MFAPGSAALQPEFLPKGFLTNFLNSMKHNLLTLVLVLATLSGSAQKRKKTKAPVSPLVSAVTVARVVTALAADDMQGRGTGQPGGLKAAQFLAAEFQRIGLQPLPGATGFEQVFPVYETAVGAMSASLNGAAVPAAQLLAFTTQPQLEWPTNQTPTLE